MTRVIDLIERKLGEHFNPKQLVINDVSAKHRNHRYNDVNRVHLELKICSESFKGDTSIQSHKKIYAALADEMKTLIHSIKITIIRDDD